jgi:hypothetical protein
VRYPHSLEPSLVLLQFKAAIVSGATSAGGSLGPPCLQWPPGCCETCRTKFPLPAEGVGAWSLSCRVRFPTESPRWWWRRCHHGIRSSVLFPASPALFSGASDEHVEVESGFAGSCTGVGAVFGFVTLVAPSEERFIKGTSPAMGEVVRQWVYQAQSSSGVSRWRVSIHSWRSLGQAPGRYSYLVIFIPALMSGVSCGFFKPCRRWGSSRFVVATGSSSTAATGVGLKAAVVGVCRWLLRSLLEFVFFSCALV